MSETAEAIDELNDRRPQPDTGDVFMYTFAAVGALTLAAMDGADAAAPGAVTPSVRGAPDASFGASVAVLTAPLEHGAETSLQSIVAGNDPGALAGPDSEARFSDVAQSSFENPFSSLAIEGNGYNDPAAFAVVGAAPSPLGVSDILQTLGAYQSASPQASNASIIAAFGDVATSPMSSLGAVARD